MKVLQLSTHTTLVPRHGGQLRSHHIGRCLENAGFDVARIAVGWRTDHDIDDAREPIIDVQRSPYWSSTTHREALTWDAYLADYYSAFAVAETPALIDDLRARIAAASPEVIVLEHPWTWPLIGNLPGVRTGAIRVVYSSQNVEAVLKRRIIEDARVEVPAAVLNGVEALERDLVRAACATVACTQSDADVFRAWGAPRAVVANNGTVPRRRENLLNALPAPLRVEHDYALFLGAWYAPNVSGFFKYIAPALSALRPNKRIVIAGTVCDGISLQLAESPLRHYQDGRLVSLGFVDSLTLDALIANTSALLLAIEYGGGSHLKTAEALVSGRPIIGTSTSFRGFREYQDLPRVTIADTPEHFAAEIHRALSAPAARGSDCAIPREFLWESTLQPFLQLMRSLAHPDTSAYAAQHAYDRAIPCPN